MSAHKPHGLFLLDDWAYEAVYGSEMTEALAQRVHFVAPAMNVARLREQPDLLRDVEFLFGGWGMPKLDADFLAQAPKLRAVFVGAGSIKPIVSDAFWARDITITSGYALNAIPVAEYTLATLLFSLKHG